MSTLPHGIAGGASFFFGPESVRPSACHDKNEEMRGAVSFVDLVVVGGGSGVAAGVGREHSGGGAAEPSATARPLPRDLAASPRLLPGIGRSPSLAQLRVRLHEQQSQFQRHFAQGAAAAVAGHRPVSPRTGAGR